MILTLPWYVGGVVGTVGAAGPGYDDPPHVLPLPLPLVLAPGQLVDPLGGGVAAGGLDIDDVHDLGTDLLVDRHTLRVLGGLALLSAHGPTDVVVLRPAGGGRLAALLLLHLLVLREPLSLQHCLTPTRVTGVKI